MKRKAADIPLDLTGGPQKRGPGQHLEGYMSPV